MLYLVKVEPNFSLLVRGPVKSGVVEVPLEAPVGSFSLENQWADEGGTGQSLWACIGGCRGRWSFRRAGGGNWCS